MELSVTRLSAQISRKDLAAGLGASPRTPARRAVGFGSRHGGLYSSLGGEGIRLSQGTVLAMEGHGGTRELADAMRVAKGQK